MPLPIVQTVIDNVAALIATDARGRKEAEILREAGVNASYLINIRKNPTADMQVGNLAKIAHALNVPPSALLLPPGKRLLMTDILNTLDKLPLGRVDDFAAEAEKTLRDERADQAPEADSP